MIFRMNSGLDVLEMLIWNVVIGAAFHVILLVVCLKRPIKIYDPNRTRYQAKSWEKGGKIYKERYKIHLWKEKVPQFIGKDGFSKEHLNQNPTLEYVDRFIMETCRGEWYHTKSLWMVGFVVVANPWQISWLFGLGLVAVHLPCKIIQRYNRFRLQILRKKLLRDLKKQAASSPDSSVLVSHPEAE